MKVATILFISILFSILFNNKTDDSLKNKKQFVLKPLVFTKLHQPPKELNQQLVKLKKEIKKYETNKRRF